jgi:hypothetical protein
MSIKHRRQRRKSGPPFLQLYRFVKRSQVWHDLSFDRRLHTNPHRSPLVNSTPAHANAATYVALHFYCLERVTSLEFDCDADGGVSRRRKWAR